MSTKTFKSANSDATKDLLVVLEVDEGVNIHTESPVGRRGVSIAPSDAPALALAILEAAGYKIAQRGDMDTVQIHVDAAIYELGCAREAQERISAEARERAELEAEALDLFNTSQGISLTHWAPSTDRSVISTWVRIAKRARELAAGRAEK